ncbi:MAG: trigger factor [Candidatus Sungbacteria bacterium]|nr:trigger factor [Candidatus Sungbacteria bacterium]
MNFTTQKLPKSQIEILVTLPFSEFEPHVKKAAALISETAKIEGFRPGKAPYTQVKDTVGEHAIYERAAEEAVRHTWAEVIRDVLDAEPFKTHPFIGRPDITVTKLAPDNEFIYKVTASYVPEVKLPDDYATIAKRVRKDKKEVSVEDEEVQKTLDWIRESRSDLIAVERTAALGDAVEIDFEMRHGGVKIESGEAKNHSFILGKAKFIPGFEDALVGMATGEEKTFTLVVPSDPPAGGVGHLKEFAGKALDTKVSMRSVKERKMPDLDEEFVKTLGAFDSVDALKKNIHEGIAEEKKEKEKQRIRIMIVDEIAKGSEMDVPDILIASEIEKMLMEIKSGVEQMGMQFEDYLQHIKKTIEELKSGWQDEAMRRVRTALALREIGYREKIEPAPEEVEEAVQKYLRQFPAPEEAEKTINPDDLADHARGVLRNEKVFEFLEHVE